MIKSKVVIKNVDTKTLVIEYKKFNDIKTYLSAMHNIYVLYNNCSNIFVNMYTFNTDINKYVHTFNLEDFKYYGIQ